MKISARIGHEIWWFLTPFLLIISQPPLLVPLVPSLFVLSLYKKQNLKFWFLAGFLFWAVTLNWVVNALKMGGFHPIFGLFTLFLLSSILSGISTVPFGFLSNFLSGKIPFSVYLPSIWTLIEFLRMKIFPWAPFYIYLS